MLQTGPKVKITICEFYRFPTNVKSQISFTGPSEKQREEWGVTHEMVIVEVCLEFDELVWDFATITQ